MGKFWETFQINSNLHNTQSTQHPFKSLTRDLCYSWSSQSATWRVVQQVEPVQASSIVKQFPELFQGLGRLKDSYKIQLQTLFALTTPRQVAVPLLPKVKAELERMEKLGVISKVTTPTEWCAGMVVVPKPNGTVRICVQVEPKCVQGTSHPPICRASVSSNWNKIGCQFRVLAN